MQTEEVTFYSGGLLVEGIWRTPDDSFPPFPAIVHGPGWLGLAQAKTYERWHSGFTDAGYGVLAFNYRGFGRSAGERRWVRPSDQLEDMLCALTYLAGRPDVDPKRIGAFGVGGVGGSNAIMAAAADDRIRAVAAQAVVADGAAWLRGMRREYEWQRFVKRVRDDHVNWVESGESELVDPRKDLMVAAPERAEMGTKKDVDELIEPKFYLQSASHIFRYRPIDIVDQLSPRALLLTCVEGDAVTPPEHAWDLYRKAKGPKKLIVQTDTTHYEAYRKNYNTLVAEMVSWFDTHLEAGPRSISEQHSGEVLYI